ncbi:hypothetical protein BS47DRAFT_1490134 [Hydnum rufescens UP504]|uniref:CCHC-type domain-containing protein n=1 Tax=Hydnum rufescens UP504 TaxID=1448309 RepID=A0A9P6AF97_9AGAM|nr:hypothetical protein BS47DRAFT_1490134 [Hydnum rufescens UP504]
MSTMTHVRMPGPQSKDAPRFRGKRILHFLAEYEFCATTAGLNSIQTIQQITHYCNTKSEQFIESLDEYYGDNWESFKARLLEFYPSEEEKPYYKVDHLIKLVRKDRKLSSIAKFDNYIREFMVIAKSLDDRKALSQMDKHDYFWHGIKPPSFHEEIATVLKNSKLWTDLTCPPPMPEVIQTVKLHLKQDLYRVPDDDGQYGLRDNETTTDSSDSDESSSIDSNTDQDTRRTGFKRYRVKHEAKPSKDKPTIIALEPKPQDTHDLVKSNIDDLAEKIGRLTIALGHLQDDTVGTRPVNLSTSSITCFMCGEQGHLLKDCPETKAFVAKKVLRWSSEGRLVQADGSDLL